MFIQCDNIPKCCQVVSTYLDLNVKKKLCRGFPEFVLFSFYLKGGHAVKIEL